jgi:maleylpyruvate isomerase
MATYDLEAAQAGIPHGQRRLERTLSTLTEAEARTDSVLPKWSRGHVLTHIARNADAMVRLLTGALHEIPAEQYPGGAAGRAADIEAGSGRPAAVLVADVMSTNVAVEAALEKMTEEAWTRTVRWANGHEFPASRCAWSRWREVEIHHVDLGLERYTIADWPAEFVQAHLPHEIAKLDRRLGASAAVEIGGVRYGSGRNSVTLEGPDHAVLAWLIGRSSLAAPHLTSSTGALPELPFWG